MSDFEIITIAVFVGICGLIKRHSDKEWERFKEELKDKHRKKMAEAIKRFGENMKSGGKHE